VASGANVAFLAFVAWLRAQTTTAVGLHLLIACFRLTRTREQPVRRASAAGHLLAR
jgi:hypothetical protein